MELYLRLDDWKLRDIARGCSFSLGIAIQNFPEGQSYPCPFSTGASRHRAFENGVLSGVVEPIGAILTIIFRTSTDADSAVMLSFAAGAMMYVVVKGSSGDVRREHPHGRVLINLRIGFSIMMTLDVALGCEN